MKVFERSILIKTNIKKVFNFHRNTNNLKNISPSFIKVKIKQISDIPLKKNSLISLSISLLGISTNWEVKILECVEPHLIKDLQVSGIFKYWLHHHIFEQQGKYVKMTDRIEYLPPFGYLGILLNPIFKLVLIFAFKYRHKKTKEIFENKD
ncbi:MAG: hypothetical protein V1773_01140 [bacterium]